MKKLVVALIAAAALAIVPASASAGQGKAYGKNIQTEFGSTYGQLLNSVRDANHPSGTVVFPPAAGAKTFYELHTSS